MKIIDCKSKKEYDRYNHLFELLGINIKHDVSWVVNCFLSEIPEPYTIVYDKNKKAIGIVSLKE